jgi:hypothetical protein
MGSGVFSPQRHRDAETQRELEKELGGVAVLVREDAEEKQILRFAQNDNSKRDGG